MKRVKAQLVDVEQITPFFIGYFNKTLNKYQVQKICLKPEREPITEQMINDYYKSLCKNYPQYGFKMERVRTTVDGREKELILITRSWESRKHKKIDIFFDVSQSKIYIRARDWKKRNKITRIVLWRVLGILKQSKIQAFYFRTKEEMKEFIAEQTVQQVS